MDTAKAFIYGELNRNKELMVFDWDKAARIIKENNVRYACAGLRGDWEWTGGVIFNNGTPVYDDYTYLASTWAVPELKLENEVVECYKMQSEVPMWNSKTKWPKSAIEILNN